MRVATGRTGGTAEQAGISIHATHAGGDYELRTNRNAGGISIHATHAGGDVTIRECGKGDGLFQSTPPMRVATRDDGACGNRHDFNPRHPCGWRRQYTGYKDADGKISIHATHAGGDLT